MATLLNNAAGRKTNNTLSGSPVGSNLLPGSPTSTPGGTWNSGTGTMTATSAGGIIYWASFLTVGKLYQVTMNYTMSSGSKLRVTNGLTNGSEIVQVSAVLGASGSLTFNFTAVDVNLGIEADTALFTGTISSIVIQETPPLIATSTGAGGCHSDRPLTGPSYFSAVITTLTGTPRIGIYPIDSACGTALGADNVSLGYLSSGVVQINGVTVATLAAYAAGNTIDVAVDPANRLIWFRVNGGNWNNNAANNPATGVGGIDYSSMSPMATYAAGFYASATGNVWTVTFTPPFTNAAPSGFITIDTVQFTIANWTNDPKGYEIPMGVPPSFGFFADQYGGDEVGFRPYNGKTFTKVSGTVMEVGVTVAGKRVDVYDRITGELLGTAYSDVSGNWQIWCLGRPNVRVVADDPTSYNSLVYDDVIPV